MKKILFCLFLFILAHAFNMNSYILKLKKNSEISVEKFYTNSFLEKISKNKNYNESLNIYKHYFTNDRYTIDNYYKVFNKQNLVKRKTILFYLFTTNMPSQSYLNVFKQAEKIKKYLPVIGVLRGMNLITKKKLDEAFRGKKIEFNGRVNPFIFRDLGIKKAPVFIVANCIVKPYLMYKSCRFLYRFDGDVTLAYALSKIGDYDEKIKRISFVFYK